MERALSSTLPSKHYNMYVHMYMQMYMHISSCHSASRYGVARAERVLEAGVVVFVVVVVVIVVIVVYDYQ